MLTFAMRRWAASKAALGAYVPYAGAIALILAAPFEQRQPVVTLSTQEFTNLELVVLVVLTAWALWWFMVDRRPRLRTTLTVPALLLLGAMILSALMAPDYQSIALRFTGRFALGFLVYLLVINGVTNRRRFVGILITAGVTGTIVSAIGILEYLEVPGIVEWLQPFRAGQHLVGGQLRVTSTLQYPTITSMYLEFIFALTLGLLLWTVSRRRWWGALLTFVALGLVSEAIILTLSRSGLIVMAGILAMAGGLWLLRRGIDRGLLAITAVAALIAGLLGYRLLSDSMLWLRLTTENDETWYRAQYEVPDKLELQTGQVHKIDVTLTNVGRVTWRPQDEETPFRLAYHWLGAEKKEIIEFEGLRTDLPRPVKPGESVQLSANVEAPPRPGQYYLEWDIVQEGRVWFSGKSPAPRTYSRAVVSGAPVEQAEPAPALPATRTSGPDTLDRRTLWKLAGQMLIANPLLGVGPDNFRLLYGRYAGLEQFDQGLHSNNMYIEFFVDLGLIGGAVFLWLLWRVLTTLYRAWPGESARLPIFLGVSGAVVAFLLHGFVDYFFEFTATYLMIWITLGLVSAFAHLEGQQHANRV